VPGATGGDVFIRPAVKGRPEASAAGEGE
jgi:hypothetical protein